MRVNPKSDAWVLRIPHPHGGCTFWVVVAALPAPSPCPPPEPLQPCALVSLTRRLTATAWIFSWFFSFSPTNMCFQYPSKPGGWRPLLLSPALILLPRSPIARLGPGSLPGRGSGAALSQTCSCIPSCRGTEISRGMSEGGQTPAEGEVGGKSCSSESWSRRWVCFPLPCEAQVTFLITTFPRSPPPALPVVLGHKWMAWSMVPRGRVWEGNPGPCFGASGFTGRQWAARLARAVARSAAGTFLGTTTAAEDPTVPAWTSRAACRPGVLGALRPGTAIARGLFALPSGSCCLTV